jgi:hypothetical protein
MKWPALCAVDYHDLFYVFQNLCNFIPGCTAAVRDSKQPCWGTNRKRKAA